MTDFFHFFSPACKDILQPDICFLTLEWTMTDTLGKFVCACQVIVAFLEGDRLILSRQSKRHARLDVSLPKNP